MFRRLSIMSFVFLLITPSFASEKITFLVGNWPPYTSMNYPNKRIAEDIVREAFKTQGVEIKIEYYPWKRAYEYVKNNRAYGTFVWIKTDEREKDFIFNKEPIIESNQTFFYLKKTNFAYNKIEELNNYKVGGVIGYFETEYLMKNGIKVDIASDDEQNFRKLLLGRIDIYLCNIIVGKELIKELFNKEEQKKFTYSNKIFHKEKMYMLFAKSNSRSETLAKKLDKGLTELKKTGRYTEIINN